MTIGAKQAFNYIIIPIIMAVIAVCCRGVHRFNRRLDPISLMERAIDNSGDINPEFAIDDARTKALSIINSNIIITDHLELPESIAFDYSDDPIPTNRDDFKEIGEIPKFPQKPREELEIGDILEEIDPDNDEMIDFFSSSSTISSRLSLSEEFLDEEDRYITETVAEFFSSEGYGLDK